MEVQPSIAARVQIPVQAVLIEAAAQAQVGPKLVYREVKAERLRATRIGARRDLGIHKDWIDEWLTASSTPVAVLAMRVAR